MAPKGFMRTPETAGIRTGRARRTPPFRSAGHEDSNEIKTITLQWTSRLATVSNIYLRMYEQEQLVDTVLATEGGSLKCHRIVVAACSGYLENVFLRHEDKPVVFIAGIKFWELKALVAFMYQGEVQVPRDRVSELLQAARYLNVRGLVKVDPVNVLHLTRKGSQALVVEPGPSPPKMARTCTNSPTSTPRSSQQQTPVEEQVGDGEATPAGGENSEANIQPDSNVQSNKDKDPEELNNTADEARSGGDKEQPPPPLAMEPAEPQLPNPFYNGGIAETVFNMASIKTEPVFDMAAIKTEPVFNMAAIKQEPFDPMDLSGMPELELGDIYHGQQQEANNGTENEVDREMPTALVEVKKEVDFDNLYPNGENDANVQLYKTPLVGRMKYPVEVRQAAVVDLVNGMGLNECAAKYNVPKKTLSNWKSKHYYQERGRQNQNKRTSRKRESSIYTPAVPIPEPQPEPARRRISRASTGTDPLPLPPVEGSSRDEHLKNAAKLVVDKLANVRVAASHYGLPRTTLSNFMRRHGLMHLRKGDNENEIDDDDDDSEKEKSREEIPSLDKMEVGSGSPSNKDLESNEDNDDDVSKTAEGKKDDLEENVVVDNDKDVVENNPSNTAGSATIEDAKNNGAHVVKINVCPIPGLLLDIP